MGRIAGVTAEQTRSQLLDAAAAVFAREGYERATIAGIASEAGLSSGAIYAHYGSKADLLAEVIRRRSGRELARFLGEGTGSVLDAIAQRGATLAQRPPARAAARGSLLLEAFVAARREPEVAATLAGEVRVREELLADLLRHARERGELDDEVAPDAVARFTLTLALGALLMEALRLPRTEPQDWAHLIGRLVDGIRTKEGTTR